MDNEEIQGVKFSEFPSQTPVNADDVVGLHSGNNARFSIANIVAAVRNGLANIFVPKSDVGAADGVASLGSNGKVPGTQLDLSGKQDKITANGILKGDGQGGVSAATAGTDYQAPLTAGTDYATPTQLADKAAKSDLSNIQATGTTNTTGAAIPVGAYFYLNGVLFQAIGSGIGSGATFTPGTNCEAVPGGGLNNVLVYKAGESYTFSGIYTGLTNSNATLLSVTIQTPKYIPANATITKSITINWIRGQGAAITGSISNLSRASGYCLILDMSVSGVNSLRDYSAYLSGTITFG